MFVVRGLAAASGFVLVPVVLGCLSAEEYGLWLTLSAIIGWTATFDAGLGNGLRNKVAEAVAHGRHDQARVHTSNAFACVGLVSGVLLSLLLILCPLLDWSAILNAPPGLRPDLTVLAAVVSLCCCARMVAGLIGVLLLATQRPGAASLLDLVAGVSSLGAIILLNRSGAGSLIRVGSTLSVVSVAIPLLATFLLLAAPMRWLRPRLADVSVASSRELLSLGGQFFVIQMISLLIFSSTNVLISHVASPADVAAYAVASKYFGLVSTGFAVLMIPFWSAFTDAFSRGDTGWIERSLSVLRRTWYLSVLGLVIMLSCSSMVYRMWVGNRVQISPMLSITIVAQTALFNWCTIYVSFVNGVGKVRLQLVGAIVVGLAFLPLAFLLAHNAGLGSAGVVAASALSLVPASFFLPVQTHRLLKGTASGVWAK